MVSIDWSAALGERVMGRVMGRGSSGPEASHGVALSGFPVFLGLELKWNRGLGVISSLTQTLSLWSINPRLCSKII